MRLLLLTAVIVVLAVPVHAQAWSEAGAPPCDALRALDDARQSGPVVPYGEWIYGNEDYEVYDAAEAPLGGSDARILQTPISASEDLRTYLGLSLPALAVTASADDAAAAARALANRLAEAVASCLGEGYRVEPASAEASFFATDPDAGLVAVQKAVAADGDGFPIIVGVYPEEILTMALDDEAAGFGDAIDALTWDPFEASGSVRLVPRLNVFGAYTAE